MEPVASIINTDLESISFEEYRKQISNKLKAKAAFASAVSQNVFASFDKVGSKIIKKLPVTL